MRKIFSAAAGLAAFAFAASSAQAAIVVDGVIGAGEYAGAIVTQVAYQPGASGFQPNSEASAYTVWYKSEGGNVHVALRTNPAGAGLDNHDLAAAVTGANLYFRTKVGAQIPGFEVFNDRAFYTALPGQYFGPISAIGAQFAKTDATTYANGGQPGTIEFSVPWTFFMDDPLGMGFDKLAPGAPLQLRISQSFGYAFATPNGAERFGSLNAPVPEPATWAMMIAGFGLIGGALRRRRALALA